MDLSRVLAERFADRVWRLVGDSYDGLVWLDDSPKPSEDDLIRLWDDVSVEVAWRELRSKRDKLLFASDWTQTLDAKVDREAWSIYRQALRDLPQHTSDPRNAVWPEPPNHGGAA